MIIEYLKNDMHGKPDYVVSISFCCSSLVNKFQKHKYTICLEDAENECVRFLFDDKAPIPEQFMYCPFCGEKIILRTSKGFRNKGL